ncbi:hypothetical protein [Solimicrobium silvestre]|uniref:Uncharacterized protein n=1 Tax=Solimicrobium silvestre TaxID=2099400 RepID=A0A2S9GXE0_9BURK|nr:hypothetical protein [Solimicrobium silvestre]PRC92387.1 hypothetical protein S2091_2762 [Solimicrobium silvestre]
MPIGALRHLADIPNEFEIINNMNKQKVLMLPYPTSPVLDGTELRSIGADIYLKIPFDVEGSERIVTVRFINVCAYRQRAESHCTSWHVKDVFDNVSLVVESDWVIELRSVTQLEHKNSFDLNHFITYVNEFGSLEVIAKDVVIES